LRTKTIDSEVIFDWNISVDLLIFAACIICGMLCGDRSINAFKGVIEGEKGK
jgi:hypothetical protein